MREEKVLMNATVCYLVKPGHTLLAKKTVKIGAGCWNGYGGGIEQGEHIRTAAIRELFEESGVRARPEDLQYVAVIDFHNTKSVGSTFVCRVHFFFLTQWEGDPLASEEMATPTWFKNDQLPLDAMMPADKIFVPKLVDGKKICGTAYYGPYQKEMTASPVFEEVSELNEA